MANFRDSVGRSWEVRITPAAMRRTKSLVGVNLGTMLADQMEPLAALVSDPLQLVDVLYCICKPQADALAVTDEQFGEGLVGDSLESAVDAFLEALSDFFPSRQGRVMKHLFAKLKQEQTDLAEKLIAEIDRATFTDFATNSEALQESTPAT